MYHNAQSIESQAYISRMLFDYADGLISGVEDLVDCPNDVVYAMLTEMFSDIDMGVAQYDESKKGGRDGIQKRYGRTPYGSNGLVYLTSDEYKELTEKYGANIVSVFIDRMDKWLNDNPNRKINGHAKRLNEWIIEYQEEKEHRSTRPAQKLDQGFEKRNYDFDEIEQALVGKP